MRENLRISLDTALKFQDLVKIFRRVTREEMQEHREQLNDELTLTMMIAFNGLGKISVQIYNAIEIITERINIHSDGDGLEKALIGNFMNDGEEDFGDTYDEPEEDEYDVDLEEFMQEWNLEEDDDDEPTRT